MAQFKIIKDKTETRLEIFNQFLSGIAGIYLIIFTDWITDEKIKYYAGWSFLSCLYVLTFINYLFIIFYGSLQIMIGYKRFQPRTVKFIQKMKAKYCIRKE